MSLIGRITFASYSAFSSASLTPTISFLLAARARQAKKLDLSCASALQDLIVVLADERAAADRSRGRLAEAERLAHHDLLLVDPLTRLRVRPVQAWGAGSATRRPVKKAPELG